ncbi:interleukin 17a/f2 [Melanotaenia boesemani]|uniref:interleukin 17a/f2 n=1 Tax=Melanotaenia boesemani TaxID=1250792 RepID=UPI001C05EBE8|nr:interleukin 17a/f2 [Melanotaenia boesemani]
MKLLILNLWTLLVCCSALWVSFSKEQAPPPSCNATLEFSTELLSLSEGNRNIHRRSLSPWTWRSTTVKDQIPMTLWEAECSSTFCSSPTMGQSNSPGLNSVPVYQNILVLHRKSGSHCYTASYRSVAVGCTCVQAKINQQDLEPAPEI